MDVFADPEVSGLLCFWAVVVVAMAAATWRLKRQ